MSEGEYLSSELDVGPNADEAEVCEEANKCVGKAAEHGGGSWRTGHTSADGGWPTIIEVYDQPTPKSASRTDREGFTAQDL